MTDSILKHVAEHAVTIEQNWHLIMERIQKLSDTDGQQFDFEAIVPQSRFSLSQTDVRVSTLTGFLGGFANVEGALLLPSVYVGALNNAVSSLHKIMEALRESLNGLTNSGDPYELNLGKFIVTDIDGNKVDFREHIKQIEDSSDKALEYYFLINSIISGENFDGFSAAALRLENTLRKARTGNQEIESMISSGTSKVDDLVSEIQSHFDEIIRISNTVKESSSEVERVKDDTGKKRETVNEHAANVNERRASVEEIASQAAELKIKVDAYENEFKIFNEMLSDRNKTYETGKEQLDNLIAELGSNRDFSSETVNDAKLALGWATASGLAKSFEDVSKELKWPLVGAQIIFYISIALFFASAVVAFIPGSFLNLPDFISNNGTEQANHTLSLIYSITIRAGILLPSIFLIAFANSRYRVLLRMKEQYVFKKTVASAIPGFKDHVADEEAGDHEKAIAAAAFERLIFNPQEEATRDLAGKPRGGLLSRWLTRIVQEAIKNSRIVD